MTIAPDKVTGYRDTGRCYIEFSFGENLASLVPEIIQTFPDAEIYVSGTNTLLVMAPLADDEEDDLDGD